MKRRRVIDFGCQRFSRVDYYCTMFISRLRFRERLRALQQRTAATST
jgi:hypothetical protein